MTRWGLPPDHVAWAALLLGLGALAQNALTRRRLLPGRALPAWWFAAACALLSALLSALYIDLYLGGGPRIIDATSYFLQGKIFASGQLAFEPPGPVQSFHSRFLVATPEGRLATLFPPGYPLFLAGFFRLGAPLLAGPTCAALLTLLTYALAKRLFLSEPTARLAALLSSFCAVLRYHTADTMSHALCGVLLLAMLLLACHDGRWPLRTQNRDGQRGSRVRPQTNDAQGDSAPDPQGGDVQDEQRSTQPTIKAGQGWRWAATGVLLSALFATRPVSGVVGAVGLVLLIGWHWRALFVSAAAATPGIAAFIWHQEQLTGRLFGLAQHRYYRTADGPPGCVRMGLGSDIGCRVEHGDFIERYMSDGYGVLEALGTTARRLAMHAADAGNSELFGVMLLVAVIALRRNAAVRSLALIIAAQILAYGAFYFDGNFPGGGARMFAEVLPLEHIVLAYAMVRFSVGRWCTPLLLIGFSFRGANEHRHLALREGGRPMFESVALEQAPGARLVFLGTDHGFNLAFDPSTEPPIIFARERGDSFDTALWESLGRPEAWVHEFDFTGHSAATLHPFLPTPGLHFEGESLWPAQRLSQGWLEPRYSATCTSAGKELGLHPERGQFHMATALWVSQAGEYQVRVAGAGDLKVEVAGTQLRLTGGPCAEVISGTVSLGSGNVAITVETEHPSALDTIELLPVGAEGRRSPSLPLPP